jgi:pimeloyl-ACP methyl ester carboxylesterase
METVKMPPDNRVHEGLSMRIERFAADAGVRMEQRGSGPPVLLLHGGGGPASVAAFANELSRQYHVIVPTHPGFASTARLPSQASIKDLARIYVALVEQSDLQDAIVIGCSIGGWIAAEMAVCKPAGVRGFVLVDAVGITVPGQAVLDVFAVQPGDLPSFSYHAPDKFRIDPAAMTEEQMAAMRSNFAALAIYGGSRNMQDPDLRERLALVQTPALIVWGESDRVVPPPYGKAYAAAFPRGRFEVISACGHLPQIEQPQRLLQLVEGFEHSLRP